MFQIHLNTFGKIMLKPTKHQLFSNSPRNKYFSQYILNITSIWDSQIFFPPITYWIRQLLVKITAQTSLIPGSSWNFLCLRMKTHFSSLSIDYCLPGLPYLPGTNSSNWSDQGATNFCRFHLPVNSFHTKILIGKLILGQLAPS